MSEAINLVVFISGNGSNLQALIDAIDNGRLKARISAVISDQPDAYGLTRADIHHISRLVIDYRKFKNRSEFDLALLESVNQFNPDYIVLAGFMRILGSDFVQAFENRIINIHPSLLPDYKGLDTHRRVLENGEEEHGVSIHLVTADLDDGPILLQGRFRIEAEDSIDDLQRKGHELEHRMYPTLLQWISDGTMQIDGDEIVFKNKPVQHPLIFSQE